MPGFTIVIDARYGRRAVARATLRTPGHWDELDEVEKAAWNKATAAIRELFELYNEDGRTR